MFLFHHRVKYLIYNMMSHFPLIMRILLQLAAIAFIFFILSLKTIVRYNWSYTYAIYDYAHLPAEHIQPQLYKKITPDLVLKKSKNDCQYDKILTSTRFLFNWEVLRKIDDFSAEGLVNGSYAPEHCNTMFSVALLVPYRNRQSQLDMFLPYIHNFLRKQNIHYRIYIIEQEDEKAFNRGVLLNIGAMTAIRDKFPCLILHDVDLLPLDESNLYACSEHPRHMSASMDKFQFGLPYDGYVGGVLAVKSNQFEEINGFSNRFEGWGGEDDDVFYRLSTHNFDVVRYPRKMSRYAMLRHSQEIRNSARLRTIKENRLLGAIDGLNSLPYATTHVKHHPLFTLVGVHL